MRCFVLIVALCSIAHATTYYVSNAGSNAAAGTSTGTSWAFAPGMAGCTSVCASTTLVAGDSVLLNQGDKWRDGINVGFSGSSGSVITYGSYGSGAKPIIDGSDLYTSGWSANTSTGTDFTSDGNLQAYYYLEETTGSTRNDGTANANNLTDSGSAVQSATHVQGSFSASFTSASSQFLTRTNANLSAGFIGKSATTNTDATWGGWFQTSTPASGQILISKGATGTGIAAYISTSLVKCTAFLDGAQQVIISNSTISANTWYHIACRINSTTKLLEEFVNGVKQTDNRGPLISTTLPVGTEAFDLGHSNGQNYFDGLLDEVFVFNRALSDNEIASEESHGLDGSRPLSNVWKRTVSTSPNAVWFNGTRGQQQANLPNVSLAANNWFWASSVLSVYSTSDPGTAFTTPGVESSVRDTIDISRSYVTVTGLDLTHSQNAGVEVSGEFVSRVGTWGHNTITLSRIHDNGIQGFQLGTFLANGDTVNNTAVTFNRIDHNGHSGVHVKDYATVNYFGSNTMDHNCQVDDGILDAGDLFCGAIYAAGTHSNNTVMELNDVSLTGIKDNGTAVSGTVLGATGLWCDSEGAGCILRYNLIHDNWENCIHFENMTGALALGNICYRSAGAVGYAFARGIAIKASSLTLPEQANLAYNNTVNGMPTGIAVECVSTPGKCTLNEVKNNISLNSTLRAFYASGGGENDGTNGSGNVYLNNSFGPQATNFIHWGASNISTYAAFDSAYGSATGSLTSDPLLVAPASGNFSLQAGSPAIDFGLNLGSSYQLDLDPRTSFPWSLANQNSFGTGWEIGAFVYTGAPVGSTSLSGATLNGASIH